MRNQKVNLITAIMCISVGLVAGAATVWLWLAHGQKQVVQREDAFLDQARRHEVVQIGTTNLFYTRDHLGSVREVIDNKATNVVARYDYDPYGRRTLVSGSDFGFTGHYLHKTTEVYQTLFRVYDPELGRWRSRHL